MKMKKMMFLMLTLFMLGAASMNAQVQIGGTNGPNKSAVLDLNGDAGTAAGGLALPRVELTSTTQQLNGATAQPGTIVYNTGTALPAGIYVWNGSAWALAPVGLSGSTVRYLGRFAITLTTASDNGQLTNANFSERSWCISENPLFFVYNVYGSYNIMRLRTYTGSTLPTSGGLAIRCWTTI